MNDLVQRAASGDAEAARALADLGRALPWRDGSELVVVPAGPFEHGMPRRRGHLADFALGMHPVTNEQYERFLGDSGYVPSVSHPMEERYLAHWSSGRCPPSLRQHPVVNVSFVDAWHYCRFYGLELPSEVMWEKAARGVDARPYPWGHWLPSTQLCWYRASTTCEIGSYPRVRTAYGCQDMAGNVSEVCFPEGGLPGDPREIDEEFLLSHIVVRGGAFLRTTAKAMHVAHRRRLRTTNRNRWVGFRVALRFTRES